LVKKWKLASVFFGMKKYPNFCKKFARDGIGIVSQSLDHEVIQYLKRINWLKIEACFSVFLV
jgi:hypothetical protein